MGKSLATPTQPEPWRRVKNMKQLETFNGAVTSCLHEMGLSSVKVLNAVNAWVGSVNIGDGQADKVDVTAGAKLSGSVTKKGEDKRVITIKESEKRTAKRSWTWQGGLYALSTACDDLVNRHGVALTVSELPQEIAKAIDRDTFKTAKAPAPEAIPA